MRFSEYTTLAMMLKNDEQLKHLVKDKNILEVYATVAAANPLKNELDTRYLFRTVQEGLWYSAKRPFYKVWPGIIPCLTKTKLTITLADLHMGSKTFAILLPYPQGSVLVTMHETALFLTVCLDDGNGSTKEATIRLMGLGPIEDLAEENPEFTPLLKLTVAVIMLDNDPAIIEREVLACDRLKYSEADAAKRQRLEDKALRRGVNGWKIGEHVEVLPHIRRPHFAIRWRDKGRVRPVLTAIKGSIVHREIVEKVPTSYMDK